MKHARPEALEKLRPLLARIRALPGLDERRPGVFYVKSRAYLHFHEDPAGMFADVRLTEEFERFPVNTPQEKRALLELLAENRGGRQPMNRRAPGEREA
jgi:hypothetical protein